MLPAAPAAAAAVFGPRLPLAVRYAELLAATAVERGLIGPREVPRLWDRHLLNCAVIGDLVPPGAAVADLGSGAGLPGIPLALARPDLRLVLIEPMQRRVAFLEEAVALLALGDRVEVRRGRADELAGQAAFDVVTARALAPLPRLLDWAGPLVRPGGLLLAVKGRTAAAELAAAGPDLRGWADGGLRVCGEGLVEPPSTVIRLVRDESHHETRHEIRNEVGPRGRSSAPRPRQVSRTAQNTEAQ